MMLAYLRFVLKRSFVKREVAKDPSVTIANRMKKLLISRPANLAYEKYVVDYYLKVCEWLQAQLYEVSTLE